ncbi:MAG: serine hydrolase [Thermomicrobiales bacterium]
MRQASTSLLSKRLAAVQASFPGHFGLAARNLRTGEEVLVDAHSPYPTASTYKVPVMIEAFRQADRGQLSLDDPLPFTPDNLRLGSGVLRDLTSGRDFSIRDLVTLMIIVSDNTATRIVLQKLGGGDVVTRAMRELGFPSFVIHGPKERELLEAAGEENRALAESTPRDLMAMMAQIAEGRIVSPEACESMRTILGRQHYLNQASRYLGRDQYSDDGGERRDALWIGSKSGMMDGMRADTGIWRFADGTQIAFAVMNEGSADHDYGSEHEGDITNGILGWIVASHWWPVDELGPMPAVTSPYLDAVLGDLR